MRVAVVVTLALLCACASQKLALAPPPGVDFSGHWRLNEADSDDPVRLSQVQADPSKTGTRGQDGGQGGGGGGGRGGGRGGRGGGGGPGGGGFGGGGPGGPVMPGMNAMGAGLRWPGREMDIKQVAGVVAITSSGINQVYQPVSFDKKPPHHKKPKDDGTATRNRDMPSRDRGDGPPAHCGWEDKTLVVQSRDADDDAPPFEQRYSVSEDGQRLIEVVGFKGGRSSGFTLSRVWDRVAPGSPAPNVQPGAHGAPPAPDASPPTARGPVDPR
ncbi:MAG: hypothetical protein QOD56_2375 [Gammaproteobacteria bacterium]|nr:hypothetical protein [Gammaproteobacteria bacterium]